MNDKINKLLEDIQKNNHKKVVVYSIDGCPACDELKEKLNKIGLTYENVEMSGNEEMWEKLSLMGGSEYVPQIEVEKKLIKEDEYNNINELISLTLSNLLNRKITIT